MITSSGTFAEVCDRLSLLMRDAPRSENYRWQGRNVSADPSARMYELRSVVFEVDLEGDESPDRWRQEIKPNLPWADDHFAERVGGEPLNPGAEWANWPWGRSAATFRGRNEMFNHSYPERLWPRWARRTPGGRFTESDPRPDDEGMRGVVLRYGDLADLVDLLVRDPCTRQAWIPLFFPEDTGWADGGRKMCSLGYQFIRRGDRLSMFYPLRSCDLVRHFRDDCYLAVRLLLWVLDRCRERDAEGWSGCVPGDYAMWMTSLHVFENDMVKVRRGGPL